MTERELSAEPEEVIAPAPPAGRLFTLGQVLTLACSNTEAQQVFCSYAELLDVLGYMLGDVPLAERIPAAIERCRPTVHLAHPDLSIVVPPAATAPDAEVLSWLAVQEREHGPELLLRPVEEG